MKIYDNIFKDVVNMFFIQTRVFTLDKFKNKIETRKLVKYVVLLQKIQFQTQKNKNKKESFTNFIKFLKKKRKEKML